MEQGLFHGYTLLQKYHRTSLQTGTGWRGIGPLFFVEELPYLLVLKAAMGSYRLHGMAFAE